MKETLQNTAVTVYRATTADTRRGAIVALPIILAAFVYSTLFLMGVLGGASAQLSGKSLHPLLVSINAARHQLWMDFAGKSVFQKSVFGLVYWFIALGWEVALVGIHLGYAVPQLGYAVDILEPLYVCVFALAIVMQATRFIDVVYR